MGEVNYDTYIVIADFEGAAENELSVKVGEKLLVLQSTPEGWSEGYTCGGRQGWFPSAYAKFDPTGKPSDVIGGAANKSGDGGAAGATNTSSNTTSTSSGGATGAATTTSTTTSSTSSAGGASSTSSSSKAPFPKKKSDKKGGAGGAKGGEAASSPFPGIRHHTSAAAAAESSPFPGIRHHADGAAGAFGAPAGGDKEKDKKKKAEEKKKEKERKKKERELKKDLRMASSGLFGVPLKASVAQEAHPTNIPFIVRACVEHIMKGNNLLREGLFRISGIKTEIDALKACFESGVEADCNAALAKAEIDAVAGLLKQYLRELPDPLFTYKHHGAFVKAGCDKNLAGVKVALQNLPLGHKETVLLMMAFLTKVCDYQEKNKMQEANIAIVFAPTIMKCNADDDNDEPEALKEAFCYILGEARTLIKDDPKIDSLLQQYSAANTSGDPSA